MLHYRLLNNPRIAGAVGAEAQRIYWRLNGSSSIYGISITAQLFLVQAQAARRPRGSGGTRASANAWPRGRRGKAYDLSFVQLDEQEEFAPFRTTSPKPSVNFLKIASNLFQHAKNQSSQSSRRTRWR